MREAVAALLVVLASGCGRGGLFFILPTACEEDPDACVSTVTVQRGADILFVIDNSGSMGREQGVLAQNFPAFIDVLEREDVGASYRIGVTTTDRDPGLRATSCRGRLEEFSTEIWRDNVLLAAIDETRAGCLDACVHDVIDITPTTTDDDPVPAPRPWLEKSDGRTNLPGGISMGEAFECIGPQGVSGFGLEAPLESMLTIVRDVGPATGFIRDHALLAVIVVTDEADCSMDGYMRDRLFTDEARPLRSDPSADEPNSAVCWNAGVVCEGGPGIYDDCRPENIDLDRQPTEPAKAVLHPVHQSIDALHEVGADKEARGGNGQVLAAVIAGVPLDYPQSGVVVYQDSDDQEFNLEYGIGPGCGRGTETVWNPPGIPPVRMLEFAKHFAPQDSGKNVFSICDNDYAVALEQIAGAIAKLGGRACIPGCVADGNDAASGFQPACTLVEQTVAASDAGGTLVPPCRPVGDGWDFPTPEDDLCWRALTDGRGATASVLDDLSGQCIARGSNLELSVERRDGVPVPSGAAIRIECVLSEPEGEGCDDPNL